MQKAQGTIEYLIIVSVVIVTSLIVVGLVVNSTESSVDIAKSSQKLGGQLQNISVMDVLLKPDGNYALDLQSNLIENVTVTRISFGEDYEDFVGDNFLALGSRKLFIVNIENLRRPDRCVAGSLVTKDIIITYTSSEGLSKTQKLEGFKIPCQVFEVNPSVVALSDCPSGQYKLGNECIACTNAVEGMFSYGSGTTEDPYLICSWEQLNNVRNKLSSSFKLINNLSSSDANYANFAGASANAGEGWIPIGNDSATFTGNFDGQEHTISNLYVTPNSSNYAGLFGYIQNAEISNVNLSSGYIYTLTSNYCGGIIGYSANSNISDSSYSGSIECSNQYAGGLSGYMNGGTIDNSYNKGTINGSYYVGGLVGNSINLTINTSYNSASISGGYSYSYYSGGLVGYATSTIINNSYNSSSATIQSNGDAGGLIGHMESGSVIENSYNQASIQGYYNSGGLVGTGSGIIKKSKNLGNVENTCYYYTPEYAVGGIAGIFSGTIENTYNTGAVTADYYAGGILGKNSGSINIQNTYNTGAINGGMTYFYGCYAMDWHCDDYSYLYNDPVSCQNDPSCYYQDYGGGDFYCYSNCYNYDTFSECMSNSYYCYADGYIYGASGGIAGNLSFGNLSNSFSTGSISGGQYLGGLVGEKTGGTITNSKWDTALSSQSVCYSGGSEGCTSTTNNAAYYYDSSNSPLSSWDWSSVWLTDGTNYPQFLWEGAKRPIISLTSPNATKYLPYQAITFNYSVSSNFYSIDNCKLYIDDFLIETDESITIGANSFTYNFDYPTNPAEEREYIWNVVCIDTNGNYSVNSEKTFNMDLVTPSINLSTPLGGNFVPSEIDFEYIPLFSYTPTSCELIINDTTIATDTTIDNNTLNSFSTTINDIDSYTWNVLCQSSNGDANYGTESSFTVGAECPVGEILDNGKCYVCAEDEGGLFVDGAGTISDPYLICSWKQLNNVRNRLTSSFRLLKSLSSTDTNYSTYAAPSANSGAGWLPIGDSTSKFTGNFNGGTYTISDIFINRTTTDFVGLFGYTQNSKISNLNVTDSNIKGKNFVGAIAGNLDGSGLTNVSASDNNITGIASAIWGLVGNGYSSLLNVNSFYNLDTTLVNSTHRIGPGAMYNDMFETWIADDKVLTAADYFTTDGNYYLINDINDFKDFLGFSMNKDLMFKLTADINLSSYPGLYIPYLTADFNGNRHKIFNLKIDLPNENDFGLFGRIDGNTGRNNVSDLNIVDYNIIGRSNLGGLSGTLINSNISNVHTNGTIKGWNGLGGIAFNLVDSNIYRSSAKGSLTANGTRTYNEVGGLVGHLRSDSYINECFANTNISLPDAAAGGFVSWFDNSENIERVTNSYAKVTINGSSSYVGGFSGPTNCTKLISKSYVLNSGPSGNCVFGDTYGKNAASNSFYDNTICTRSAGGNGFTGKSTALMKTQSTFTDAGWDFVNVWGIDPSINNGYPYLLWEQN